MATKQSPRSVKEIEADLAARRDRLSRNVDTLATKVSPQTLKANAVASVKDSANSVVFTKSGELRYDRVALGLGSVGGSALLLGALRRALYRG